MKHLTLALTIALAACDGGAPAAGTAPAAAAEALTGQAARFDAARVAGMKRQLLKEPKISDLVFDPAPMSVTWQVGVADDGTSRVGYAAYVCTLLQDQGLVDDHTDVRIVDIEKVRTSGDFRGASLGHIRCKDQQDMGV